MRLLDVFGRCGLYGAVAMLAASPAYAKDMGPDLPTLIAPRVYAPPVVDGDSADRAWLGAGRLDIPTSGGPTVHVRAVVAEDVLYLLARWSDPTETVRKQVWYFDGAQWRAGLPSREVKRGRAAAREALVESLGPVPEQSAGAVEAALDAAVAPYETHDEDRLAIIWPTGALRDPFARTGCAYLCHTLDPNPATHDMWTNAPNERADLWHWKSARSNPVHWADDQQIVHVDGPEDEGGRRPDPDDSVSYAANRNDAGTGPAYTFAPGERTQSAFLLRGAAVPIAEAPPPEPGTTVPGYVLARPSGSRGDIRAAGLWREGEWTLELARRLQTGHEEDVQFVDGMALPFAVAVMDNGGGHVHTTSGPVALRLTTPTQPPELLPLALGLVGAGALVALVARGRRNEA